ncbi:uncharacterized protein LOC121367551 [Gigantopelta aegis]|uniref:uncharacterized protein LOC121367551 n=1 Tax=Gigantopelta aegis TaxID=1735272 RepID=UPI001B888069|nr:uncharacterized protein LOC121367551 [Gigantopelta aegis]
MTMLVLALILLAAGAHADITHASVHAGSCVCVHGAGVHARNQPGVTGTHVRATLNSGSCFTLTGGVITKDGYKWFEVNYSGQHLWIAGNFLVVGSSSSCSGGSSLHTGGGACHDAQSQQWACDLLKWEQAGRIFIANRHPSGHHDSAYPIQNIKDACAGRAAARSSYSCVYKGRTCSAPGGHVCLDHTLLHYLHTLASTGLIRINELSGACHSCNSRHYRGVAVDLHNDGRTSVLISKCRSMGGHGWDEGNHVHCQFGY